MHLFARSAQSNFCLRGRERGIMSDTAEGQFSWTQLSYAEGNKEQHSITSRLAFLPHSSFMNSALGASTAEMMQEEVQMRIGDEAGSVLVTPFLDVQKVLQAVLPLPTVMGESWEGTEGVGI